MGLTAYACFEKEEISIVSEVVVVFAISIVGTIVCAVFTDAGMGSCFIIWIIVITYGSYILIDVRYIVNQDGITPDDYILGSVMIYIDIIGMFVRLLACCGNFLET
jgi:FtsH-binding integral membrane protein